MLLDTLEKYYVSDTGMRNAVLGLSSREDISRLIENIVYLELLRRGYEVALGKYSHKEVDFTARRADEIQYIQATMSMLGEDKYGREIAPFRLIRDNYAKTACPWTPSRQISLTVCTTSNFWNSFLKRNDRYR